MKDRYESPLCARYASERMQRLFSPDRRFQTWRRLWTELARAEHAQILREHVPVRTVVRVIRVAGGTGIEPLLILGVVARDALQRAAALQIDAAVADMRDIDVARAEAWFPVRCTVAAVEPLT